MLIYKEICEEVAVDVDLEDFDFREICKYVAEIGTNNPSWYEQEQISKLAKAIFYKNMRVSDWVHQMEREEFETLFELMKISWQAK